MILKDIKTWVTVPPTGIGGAFWVIVKITTDSGIEGIGECYGIPVSGDIACTMVEDTFARFVEGEDPHNIETLFRRVYSAGFTQRPDVSMMGVFSGMEIAIWDILGKAHDTNHVLKSALIGECCGYHLAYFNFRGRNPNT